MQAQLFKTKWGWGAVLYTQKGVREVFLPKSFKAEITQELPKGIMISGNSSHPAAAQLVEYFSGERSCFELEFDLEGATPFQKRVYSETAKIPYGGMRSYQELARAVGMPRGSRAVARALSMNPVLVVIPCHRVVQKNGKLGGFSGGVTWKSALLDIERSQMKHRFTEQSDVNLMLNLTQH